ncbi:MAG: hypothetical protein ACTSU9_08775, partial [Promethearchaeota archaeon]
GLSATNFYPLVNSSWPRVNFSDWLDTKWQFPAAGWNIASRYLDDDEYLAAPKTVDQYQSVDFLWQRTPWQAEDFSPASRQDSGLSFLLPYYMGRFHGFILEG